MPECWEEALPSTVDTPGIHSLPPGEARLPISFSALSRGVISALARGLKRGRTCGPDTFSSDGITPASLLKNGIPADQLALQNAQSVSLASAQRNPAYGYSQQWNLNLQYQLARDWMVQVGYFGSRGTHLVNLLDTNYVESLGPGNINARRRYKSIFVPLSVPGQAGPVSGVTISPLGQVLRTEYE